jgi:hypothetical protein
LLRRKFHRRIFNREHPRTPRPNRQRLHPAKKITVSDVATLAAATTIAAELKGLVNGCEACRKEIKAPVLVIGDDIDLEAKNFKSPAQEQINRFATESGLFIEAEEARAEAARKAEEARQAAEAAAETARLNAIAAAERAAQAAKGKAAQAAAEAQAQKLRDEQIQSEIDRSESTPVALPVFVSKVAGASVNKTPEIFVHDLHALYKAHPQCVKLEEKLSAIKDLVSLLKSQNKAIEIPGVTVSFVTDVRTKATRSNLAIQ